MFTHLFVRMPEQIEVATTDEVLASWPREGTACSAP
jgi:hypothetical protein